MGSNFLSDIVEQIIAGVQNDDRVLNFMRLGVFIDAGALSTALKMTKEQVTESFQRLASMGVLREHSPGVYALAPEHGGPLNKPVYREPKDSWYTAHRWQPLDPTGTH